MGKTKKTTVKLTHALDKCRYWAGVSVCKCDIEYPIGGCLKCDMDNAVEMLQAAIKRCEDDRS